MESTATQAAEHGALLLTGEAGQGKTHLFCDVAQRAVKAGRPAIVYWAGSFLDAVYGPRSRTGWVSVKLARRC